jgi:3-oxoacyl-[acyl-carrier-protein] synthase-3
MTAFMEQNELKTGVLITADPYTRIVDENDKNTALLFGDAATATLLTDSPRYIAGAYTFGTLGIEADQLALRDGHLYMNGRAVFNFAARYVPDDVREAARRNGLTLADIDAFVFHQGSKYMLDTVRSRLGLPAGKGEFTAGDYGNTVSSSIPIILEHEISYPQNRHILVSGFGVGFSWSSTVLRRI